MTANGNAARFIAAYNTIDSVLRTMYNFRTNITFTDLIRRCSSLNTVIRVYEDDLVELARLRNAIIHNKSETIIAEPNTDVTETLEKIARLISTPPLAIEIIRSGAVDIADGSLMLKDLIVELSRIRHSSIPIYKGSNLLGVIRWRKFVEVLGGHVISQGGSIDDFIGKTTVEEFLRSFPCNNHYVVAGEGITIEQVLGLFNQNRKLACIIITKDGTPSLRPTGIVTGGDVMDLMKVLENY
ncbi:MAG: hypothetical protein FWE38_02800 [Firmicutes bacterium]|nr:hypothetical protein [Bacillota bacterium]